MTLAPGSRLGPYELVSPLGVGGMGEVYKAKDTRLDRTVAIKVLPSHLSSDPDLRARFEREAHIVSSLNHPHICTVHDIGHQEGVDFLVMEYLEGETLADRLVKGPIPLEGALRVGMQIADALDRAHRAGVVHRDLKPGNVILTKSGAKLLDFGLAKTALPSAGAPGLSALATEAKPLTEKGTVLGTVQYMAPEQLEGKDADARTDIFALGSVLFEMLTGKRAFAGASQASLIGAILRDEPRPISAIRPMTPPALDRVVRTCLAKDPEERWQSAHDLGNELRWIAEGGSQPGLPVTQSASRRRRVSLVGAAVAALFAAALGVALGTQLHRGAPIGVVRASILPPGGVVLETRWPVAGPVTVSPDGTTLAFTARKGEGAPQLWVRALGEASARALAGTEGATMPFWSPDGRFIGFASSGKLRKIEASGGPVFTLCDMPDSRGATWNRDGVILFSPAASAPLFSISASGGSPVQVTELDQKTGENTHRYPSFLPDGKHFLYLARRSGAGAGHEPAIRVGRLGSREWHNVVEAASNAVYASGHLLYVRQGTLVAQAFDLGRLQVTGDVLTLMDDVRMDERFSLSVFSVSDGGLLVCQRGKAQTSTQLKWLDRKGRDLGLVSEPAGYFNGGYPVLSPDGTQAAGSILDLASGLAGIWVVDARGGTRTRVSASTVDSYSAVWSPDGRRIAFRKAPANASTSAQLVIRSLGGAGLEEVVSDERDNLWKSPVSWSRDGRFLLYEAGTGGGGTGATHLIALSLTGDRKPLSLVLSQRYESQGAFSPDGRLVAYVSDESDQREVYVASFPGPGGKWQVSQNGGSEPRWRADGRELFFFAPDNRLMAAQVKTGDGTFQVGAIEPLFQTRAMGSSWRYDASSDGQRFLVNTALPDASTPEITLVLNWTGMLRRN